MLQATYKLTVRVLVDYQPHVSVMWHLSFSLHLMITGNLIIELPLIRLNKFVSLFL